MVVVQKQEGLRHLEPYVHMYRPCEAIASQLTKLFTHQSLELVSSDQGREELRGGAVEKLILTLWKL